MSSVNQVTLLGNLGKDPEIHNFPNGGQICRLSLATSDRWFDQKSGEWREYTEWHSVVLRGRAIEMYAPRLQKGTKVFIQGSIRSNRYTDKKGVERTNYDINADIIKIISGGLEQQNHMVQNQNQGYQQPQYNQQQNQQNWNQNQPSQAHAPQPQSRWQQAPSANPPKDNGLPW